MGQKLASTLNQLIDAQVSDDMSHADVIERMANMAWIDTRTIDKILQGDINCPPIESLRELGKVFGNDSEASLRSAAESDGCDYEERKSSAVPIREVIPKEQYLRLQRIKEDLERALEPGSSLDS